MIGQAICRAWQLVSNVSVLIFVLIGVLYFVSPEREKVPLLSRYKITPVSREPEVRVKRNRTLKDLEGDFPSQEKRKFDFEAYRFTHRYHLHMDVRPKIRLGPNDKYNHTSDFDNLNEIPLIIHQTYKDSNVPKFLKRWMESWITAHPNMQYWFWTDEDINNFMAVRYTDFETIFDGYKTNNHRADAFRYFVMYEFGGLYVDTDIECLKSIQDLLSQHSCILSTEHMFHRLIVPSHRYRTRMVSHALMACRPRHPFFLHTIGYTVTNSRHMYDDVFVSTGTLLLEDSYAVYEGIQNGVDLPFIADHETFQPWYDPKKLGSTSIRSMCKDSILKWDKNNVETQKPYQDCSEYLQGNQTVFDRSVSDKSLAIHHWARLWDPNSEWLDGSELGDPNSYFNVNELEKGKISLQ